MIPMIRSGLLVLGLLAASAFLIGQNAPSEADSAVSQSPSADGRYVSGFEILNPGRNPDALDIYPTRILESIRSKWNPKIRELQKSIGRKTGTVVIEFEIGRDGSIGKMKTVESTGDASMDSAAVEAISSSAPFKPLPGAYREKRLAMRMHFGYDQPGSAAAPFCDGPNSGAHSAAYELHFVKEGVLAPKLTYDPEPEYSEQGRRAKYQSDVHLAGTVDPQGAFTDVCVSEAAGEGLDENAVESVRRWKFEPATMKGEPVAVRINVEVTFRLY